MMASGKQDMMTVMADGPPEEVVLRVKQAILQAIVSHGPH
jgi:hypothetical protein